jgi:tetratricopeptide (TPR) repeat protein
MRPNLVCILALSVVLLPGALRAQQALPPEAQEPFNLGLAAVEQNQWDSAVGYFSEAQKAAPKNPRVMYNLGLAHSKAGHLLAGMAWLHAYLAASPSAANAEAVRMEIARLQVANDMRAGKVAQQALTIAQQISSEHSFQREMALETAIRAQAYAGDIYGALRNQSLSATTADELWTEYLVAKAWAGDVQTAMGGFEAHCKGIYNHVLMWVLDFKLQAKDWDGAHAIVEYRSQLGESVKDVSAKDMFDSIDRFRSGTVNQNRNDLDEWLALSVQAYEEPNRGCGIDLNLNGPIQEAGHRTAENDVGAHQLDVVTDLVYVVNELTMCSGSIQKLDRALAWQAAHAQPTPVQSQPTHTYPRPRAAHP